AGEIADQTLASLLDLEGLSQRVLAEIHEIQSADSWGSFWSGWKLKTESVWRKELFVIDDRAFRVGGLLRSGILFAFVLGIASFLQRILRRTVFRHLCDNAASTETSIDDILLAVVRQTHRTIVVVLALYAALRSLPLSESMAGWLDSIAIIAIVFQVATWGSVAFQDFIERTKRRRVQEDPSSVSAFGLMGFFGRVAIWTVALLITLDNLGFEITALVAGLGVGGIAIAFALQSILGDIFCSIAILLDKPFVVGDFIIVQDMLGSVENIGIKTTRLRSLSGEQIVFSNADLLSSRIRNFKRMYERRVLFSFGVVYETDLDNVEAIPGIVREIIESIDKTRFDRAHFKEYGDFALNYEVVYYVLDADYNVYMDIQQEINIRLFREFKERDIHFAYPTRELIVRSSSLTTSMPSEPGEGDWGNAEG
ncbi:MAG: mechanosensitive ion channel family protein, partial [Candidatus Omnitrophica bacterium]|nr:mechanosensitive ion channel family protein [Candidatus Omnitrophota bacterium]